MTDFEGLKGKKGLDRKATAKAIKDSLKSPEAKVTAAIISGQYDKLSDADRRRVDELVDKSYGVYDDMPENATQEEMSRRRKQAVFFLEEASRVILQKPEEPSQ
jgi:hypothetical protein